MIWNDPVDFILEQLNDIELEPELALDAAATSSIEEVEAVDSTKGKTVLPGLQLVSVVAMAAHLLLDVARVDILRTRLIHAHAAPVYRGSIERADRGLSLCVAAHFNEGETSGVCRISVFDDIYAQNSPKRFEESSQTLLRCVDCKIPDEDVLHSALAGTHHYGWCESCRRKFFKRSVARVKAL